MLQGIGRFILSHWGMVGLWGYDRGAAALAEQMEDAVMRKPHRLLGNILLEKKWITEEQMKSILDEMGVSYRVVERSWDRNIAATISY
jgi:hypothetical protein